MVIYLADEDEVVTLDGREAAPLDPRYDRDVFLPIPANQRRSSGHAIGVPGTLATWVKALEDHGTITLRQALRPGMQIAENGFVVDSTYASQTAGNLALFRRFPATAATFLVDNNAPAVGSVVRNPDLANTYRYLGLRGNAGLFEGPLAEDLIATVQGAETAPGATPYIPGYMTLDDLAAYEVLEPAPTHQTYRGYDIYGMGPPSSGGITVGESLNIMEEFDLPAMTPANRWHYLSEATALAYADRGAYIGDNRPGFVYVPITGLLSQAFAAVRAALISATTAMAKPTAPGNPCPYDGGNPACVPAAGAVEALGGSTTHLTTADRWGNVVSYTLTIEATGGSGITVPGWGFLLNNELTDFDATGNGPNLPAPGKRPRSSMSPTIVLDDGEPWLAVGTPGGATIITSVIAVLMNRIDGGMTLGDAVAAPRSSQRNTAAIQGEAAWITAFGPALQALGHSVTSTGELGAMTGIEMLGNGRFEAAAEPVRRGGGSAAVVDDESVRRR